MRLFWSNVALCSFPSLFPLHCSLQKTCCTHPLRRRRGGTRRSVLFRVLTLISWMWNVQVEHCHLSDCKPLLSPPSLFRELTDVLYFSSPGCYKITTVFSHAQTVVLCVGCSTVLCQPTGGKARLTEGQYHPAVDTTWVLCWCKETTCSTWY